MTCTNVYLNKEGVPCRCRKCLNCQITYRLAWSMRMMHESTYYPISSFITFTYNDDYLPKYGSLVKEHMQKFFRDLRYDFKLSPLSKTLPPDSPLKYFVAGEYGELMRPHYHAVVFGLSPFDRTSRELVMDNWPRCDWLSLPLNKCFGTLTPGSAEYVAGYIHKKYNGSLQRRMYTDNNLVPPYSAKSLGIGKRYAVAHARQIVDRGYVLSKTGAKLPVPKYYYDLLIINPRKELSCSDDLLNNLYFDLIERNSIVLKDYLASREASKVRYAENFTRSRRGSFFHKN